MIFFDAQSRFDPDKEQRVPEVRRDRQLAVVRSNAARNADAHPSLNTRRPAKAALDHLQQSLLGEAEHAWTCEYQVVD